MKELTIEQKAQRYDEAIKKAKDFYKGYKQRDNQLYANDLETTFPELRESKDEKIRQKFIKLVKMSNEVGGFALHKWEADEMLAWLEKQGKETNWKPSKEEMDVLYGLAYITNQYDEHKEEVITRLYQDLKREFFNGSSYENMFPNTEDGVRRRSTIQVLEYARSLDTYNQYGKADIDKNIAWLEKQGEPRVNMIQWNGDNLKEVIEFTGKSPKFGEWFKTWEEYENYVHSHGNIFKLFCEDGSHYEVPVSAWIVKTPDGYNIASKAKYKQNIEQKPYGQREECLDCQFNYVGECKGSCAMKRNEQKPSNKIEPKFKVGDWIVNDYCFGKVIEITNDAYLLDTGQGIPFSCEHNVHLWTIQDAKDGDVLVFKNNIGGIIICKSPSDYDTRSYCRLIRDNLINKEESGWDSTLLVPATKEQSDLLFSKMKEVGYEWNSEKKELKKLSQRMILTEAKEALYDKPTDEEMKELLRTEYEKGRADTLSEMKSSWSEEDESIALGIEQLCNCASLLNIAPDKIDKIRTWLRSLKERYTWKPSK